MPKISIFTNTRQDALSLLHSVAKKDNSVPFRGGSEFIGRDFTAHIISLEDSFEVKINTQKITSDQLFDWFVDGTTFISIGE